MRDNYRPNLRLATNILLVIGTFLIAFKIGSLNKYPKIYQQRKADCAGNYAIDLPEYQKAFLKNIILKILIQAVELLKLQYKIFAVFMCYETVSSCSSSIELLGI